MEVFSFLTINLKKKITLKNKLKYTNVSKDNKAIYKIINIRYIYRYNIQNKSLLALCLY